MRALFIVATLLGSTALFCRRRWRECSSRDWCHLNRCGALYWRRRRCHRLSALFATLFAALFAITPLLGSTALFRRLRRWGRGDKLPGSVLLGSCALQQWRRWCDRLTTRFATLFSITTLFGSAALFRWLR